MTILETNKIDIIGTKPGSDTVKLVIADDLGWDDLEDHSRLLQDKINTYIAFVESGQLARTTEPKIPEKPKVCIVLAVQEGPPDVADAFLAQVKDFLAGINVEFSVEVHSD